MADSLGSTIDKLFTIDMKMWNNQELLYEIRRMSFQDFNDKYITNEEGAKNLWTTLQKACDLNVQRNALIDEIDTVVVEMIMRASSGATLDDGRYIQRKHKTY
jgi:hypothetical protein